MSSFLSYPSPPARVESFKPKSCGRVLTSSENLAIMEEKEREKKEKQKEREEARKKKAAKAEEIERKKKEPMFISASHITSYVIACIINDTSPVNNAIISVTHAQVISRMFTNFTLSCPSLLHYTDCNSPTGDATTKIPLRRTTRRKVAAGSGPSEIKADSGVNTGML